MNQSYEFPRITTRGYYDLHTGESLGKEGYYLYPKKKFRLIEKAEELVIFVHGMRNTRWGAKRGALTLRQTIRKLGYKKHPVVAFSYDADVRGAHLEKNYKQTLNIAYKIATLNGVRHLSKYIIDLKNKNPNIKIHLVGHSLGCEVVKSTVFTTPYNMIESVHLFGSPVERRLVKAMSYHTNKIINYYNPTDEEIRKGKNKGEFEYPSCLVKINLKKVESKECLAKDHRFRSYAEKLRKFP